ncbi:polymer-forming cytoskeletal protein [Polaribacter sp. IC073]|uniref:bactofilin family protein n=1 Tax=Polaribacter sp. IC073 TaxID=2508540 RepID=UPI0011BD57F9|nr:polymer-forming cytoskeletal protein [Polaribacter sp. IC073]TXD49915.1 polymer-forming cytoskeletal protein [Polaribacter sp. IC073]
MFKNKDKKQEMQKGKPRTMERNVIAKNSTFVGDITSDGDFRIDGVLEGILKTKGRVIIGVEGLIKGNVECANADIEGAFSGQLSVANTLTIKATANISGDVVIGKLSIEPGATFNATCAMKGALKELNKAHETKKYAEKTA